MLLAAKRRRGEPCDELEDWVRADPAAAEMVELQDEAARQVRSYLDATAPSAEHRALWKTSLLAETTRRSRNGRLRWVAALAVAAALVIAVPLLWRPAIVGRATVTALGDASRDEQFNVRAGQTVTANAGTTVHIDLGGGQVTELQPQASVSVHDHRTAVLDGQVSGMSGSFAMRIDIADWSILLEPGTRFRVSLADQRCILWTDHEAKLLHGSGERMLIAGETTMLELNGPAGQ